MKGRKPDQNAIRRGSSDRYGIGAKAECLGVTMPYDIAQDPVQSEFWTLLAPPTNTFTDQDVPTLRLLCYWHAVAAHAQQEMAGPIGSGKIAIMAEAEKGKVQHPAVKTLKQASAEIRALNDQLGLSPLARSRIGLMQATAVKTAADTAKMFKSIDGAYDL